MKLAPTATIAQILAARPAAFRVFLRNGMACGGCCLAAFETLADAAAAYGLEDRRLLRELEKEMGR